MKVLIAIDHSDFARAITDFVVKQMWPEQTQFVIMNVVQSPKVGNVYAALPGPVLDDLEIQLTEEAKELVSVTAHAIQQGCPEKEVLESVVSGFPKEEIIDYATKNKVDLIIVGSHGKSGITRFLLGSVSMAVLSHAPCSVAVVRLPHLSKLDAQATKALVSKTKSN